MIAEYSLCFPFVRKSEIDLTSFPIARISNWHGKSGIPDLRLLRSSYSSVRTQAIMPPNTEWDSAISSAGPCRDLVLSPGAALGAEDEHTYSSVTRMRKQSTNMRIVTSAHHG